MFKSELLGHLLVGTALDENRAQHFVPAVICLGRLEEKLTATGVIHDRCSLEMSVGIAGQTKTNRKAKTQACRRDSSKNWPKTRYQASGTENLTHPILAYWPENRLTPNVKNAGKIDFFGLKMSVDFRLRKSAMKH